MEHHDLDVYPIPREKSPRYINEPWLIDDMLWMSKKKRSNEPAPEKDNIRVYLPLDLNRAAILKRLAATISKYGKATKQNEGWFSQEVEQLIAQSEIYDQIWYVRHIPKQGRHSIEAIQLVRAFVEQLEAIPDDCAEAFPLACIQRLREKYLSN